MTYVGTYQKRKRKKRKMNMKHVGGGDLNN
jgi:hypothetical protein